jgi:hypothetical protein
MITSAENEPWGGDIGIEAMSGKPAGAVGDAADEDDSHRSGPTGSATRPK